MWNGYFCVGDGGRKCFEEYIDWEESWSYFQHLIVSTGQKHRYQSIYNEQKLFRIEI